MRLIRAVVIAAVALCVLAVSASAAKPDVVQIMNETNVIETTDLCAFPVTVEATVVTGTLRFFLDGAGNLVAINIAYTEQDTFIANGNTIVGTAYQARDRVTFDAEGNVTENLHGIAERITLPDGTKFLSAGRRVAVNAPPGFFVEVQTGHTGDVDALCAALAA
jgi:hypothetical protein